MVVNLVACMRALAASRSQVPTRALAVSRSTFSPSGLSWLPRHVEAELDRPNSEETETRLPEIAGGY